MPNLLKGANPRVYVSIVVSNRLCENEERPGLADVFYLRTSLDRLLRHRVLCNRTATRSKKDSKSNHVHEDEEVFEPVLRRGLVDTKAQRGGIYL
jgi:hypothetical protein